MEMELFAVFQFPISQSLFSGRKNPVTQNDAMPSMFRLEIKIYIFHLRVLQHRNSDAETEWGLDTVSFISLCHGPFLVLQLNNNRLKLRNRWPVGTCHHARFLGLTIDESLAPMRASVSNGFGIRYRGSRNKSWVWPMQMLCCSAYASSSPHPKTRKQCGH